MDGLEHVIDFDFPAEVEIEEHEHWSELFRYDRYNWHDPAWNRRNIGAGAWLPVLLTRGYFMMVSPARHDQMSKYPDGSPKRWTANVQRHPEDGSVLKVYAYRRGRGSETNIVYAHCELADSIGTAHKVDHMNGWSLDNRHAGPEAVVNLCLTTSGGNRCNIIPPKPKNPSLPVGVKPLPNGRFKGILFRRLRDGTRKCITSSESWDDPKPAAAWYQEQLARIHRRTEWVHNPRTVSHPDFPPEIERPASPVLPFDHIPF